jgi:glycosyltransferase involved in cell wall biosynthesis
MTPMQVRPDEVVVVVPAYNEGQVIASTLGALRALYPSVVCVNDGSSDDTAERASVAGVIVLTHAINLGQGAALATGISYALKALDNWKYLVTFDSDGQHDPAEIDALVQPLASGEADVVLGSRFLGRVEGITSSKRLLLKTAVAFTRVTSRMKVTDTHNGLRAFTRGAIGRIVITQPGMAHASEILHEIHRNRLRYVEVPTTITYTDYSKAKGQSALNAVNIVFDMMLRGRKS